MFDIKQYWNNRWQAQGIRGGVSVYQTVDAKYNERNERDFERIKTMIDWIGKKKFSRGLEVGTGTGRLTPFLGQFLKEHICVDGSENAREMFIKSDKKNRYEISLISNLAEKFGEKQFDLAFTFTVVQHINDRTEWDASLKAIQSILNVGGYYVLHEDVSAVTIGFNPAPHMNDCGLDDYKNALDKSVLIKAQVLYYQPSNEYDLLAVFKRVI